MKKNDEPTIKSNNHSDFGLDPLFISKAREAASEGTVLLKNDNNVLPLKENERVSVFGRSAIEYFYSGYGSGGDVNAPYTVNLYEGLENNHIEYNKDLFDKYTKYILKAKDTPYGHNWGEWPLSLSEPKLGRFYIKETSRFSDTAIIVIGRSAGEDKDLQLIKGMYYLTDTEEENIKFITEIYKKTILILNTGNIIDFSFTRKYHFDAIILSYQGGMESGNSLADILSGKVNPSGKLTDTIADKYENYPSSMNFGEKDFNCYKEDIYIGYRFSNTFYKESIMYPFGYGLSYTTFKYEVMSSSVSGTKFTFNVLVTNTGNIKGKEVIELYMKAPSGKMGKPERELVAYNKTKLLDANESEALELSFDLSDHASFDDAGYTGNLNCYVLEQGIYEFYLGESSVDNELIYSYSYDLNRVIKKVNSIFTVKKDSLFDRFVRRGDKVHMEVIPYKTPTLKERVLSRIKEPIPLKESFGETLEDVKNGKITMDEFISTLTLEELEHLSYGDLKMNSPLGVEGNGGAFGGITEELRKKGIPPVIVCDGPSGLRLGCKCTMMPDATMIASTWNLNLIEELGKLYGEEIKKKEIDVILGPGMNIHRNPLCGRNFEYYSEDPLLSGLTAAAMINGIEMTGIHATPKHFLCNHQEFNRFWNDSLVSERALREIYLRNFEIMLKNSYPGCLMTSYNRINGQHGHYDYDGVTEFLRIENNYTGLIMSDWWMRFYESKEFPLINGNAYRVRSGINVLMPGEDNYGSNKFGDTLLINYSKDGGITLYELEENARYVLNLAMNSSAYDRFNKNNE